MPSAEMRATSSPVTLRGTPPGRGAVHARSRNCAATACRLLSEITDRTSVCYSNLPCCLSSPPPATGAPRVGQPGPSRGRAITRVGTHRSDPASKQVLLDAILAGGPAIGAASGHRPDRPPAGVFFLARESHDMPPRCAGPRHRLPTLSHQPNPLVTALTAGRPTGGGRDQTAPARAPGYRGARLVVTCACAPTTPRNSRRPPSPALGLVPSPASHPDPGPSARPGQRPDAFSTSRSPPRRIRPVAGCPGGRRGAG